MPTSSPFIRFRGILAAMAMHRVYMYFVFQDCWHIWFMEPDLRTPLPRKLNFAGADKIREMFERFGESKVLEYRHAMDYAIEVGRGLIWLDLSDDQYAELKHH